MAPRFVMFYPQHEVVDDGEDVEITFKVPRVWLGASRDGLQSIVKHRHDGKPQVVDSHNQYCVMQNGEPMGTDDLSSLFRSMGLVKSGLWIPDVEFDAVRKRVQEYRRQWNLGK